MSTSNIVNAIQLITGLAAVVGLVVVFVELHQVKSLSLADITSEGYTEAIADCRAEVGDKPAPILANSFTRATDLQPEEMVVLHAYVNSKIAQVLRLRALETVADFGVPWQVVAQQQFSAVLSFEPGKAWFEQHLEASLLCKS